MAAQIRPVSSDENKFYMPVAPPLLNEILKPFPTSLHNPLNSSIITPEIPLQNSLPATWNEFKLLFMQIPISQTPMLIQRFHQNMEAGKKYSYASLWFEPEERFRTFYLIQSQGSLFSPVFQEFRGGLSTSVFQELYDEYSHEGKMRRKYDGIILKDNMERQLSDKYNVELVKQLTGLSSDSAAYAFMFFCDFKNDSLLHVSNYDVQLMIKNCWRYFEATQTENTY